MSQNDPITEPRAHLVLGYLKSVADAIMRLDCPPGEHHPAICPRCQASMQLAKAMDAAQPT